MADFLAELKRRHPTADYNWVFAYSAEPEQVISGAERLLQVGLLQYEPVFDAPGAPFHNTKRFKKFLGDAGLVAYWRAKGWPELCHPTTADDFACE